LTNIIHILYLFLFQEKVLKFLKLISKFADFINEWVGYFTSWLTAILVLVVCYDVFTRYVLKNSYVAVQELEWHIFAIIFLVGAAYTLKVDKHVRVDVIYTKMTPKAKALVNLTGTLIFLLPFTFLVVKTAVPFAINAYHFNECSPDPGGLPHRWILKSAIVVGFSLLFMQGISLAIKSFLILTGNGEEVSNG